MLEPQLARVASVVIPESMKPQATEWGVFIGCFACSAVGVFASFLIFGGELTGPRFWVLGLVISIVMLGVSYSAKYASVEARGSFTPMDLVQYLSQGFLWPSTWPGLAEITGIQQIEPPVDAGAALIHQLISMLA